MIRVTAKLDTSVLQKKADRFEQELRHRPDSSRATRTGTPDREKAERSLRKVFEPVQAGFYEHVKPRLKNDVAFLTSKKVGVYRMHWPNMSSDLGEMERFAGERALLGQVDGAPEPFDATNWDEPFRMVVPQDAFDALLDRQLRRTPLSLMADAAWWKLLGLAVFAFATPYGLLPAFRQAVGETAAASEATVRRWISAAAKKAGFDE